MKAIDAVNYKCGSVFMTRVARKSITYQMEEYGWLSSGQLGEHHGANPSQSLRIGGLPEQV